MNCRWTLNNGGSNSGTGWGGFVGGGRAPHVSHRVYEFQYLWPQLRGLFERTLTWWIKSKSLVNICGLFGWYVEIDAVPVKNLQLNLIKDGVGGVIRYIFEFWPLGQNKQVLKS